MLLDRNFNRRPQIIEKEMLNYSSHTNVLAIQSVLSQG